MRGRAYELAGYMAGIGEQLALSCTAEREYEAWKDAPAEYDPIEIEMGQRSMAELAVHYVVAVAHGLFNLACRTVALDATLHPVMAHKKQLNTACPPFSEERDDWPTASEAKVDKLSEIARRSAIPEVQRIIEPIATFLSSPEWKKLDDCRGETFHRWRGQSAGMTGVGKGSPWEDNGVTSAIHSGADLMGTDAPTRRAQETMTIASESRKRLIQTMTQLEECLLALIAATTSTTVAIH